MVLLIDFFFSKSKSFLIWIKYKSVVLTEKNNVCLNCYMIILKTTGAIINASQPHYFKKAK
ncbi:MAG: hypothetical protein CVT92_09795 [Bacteroidetes bacterium HGW-Bacteroidetes-1]|nr:MAG: hypothetical protein CVT92_09795 [Bacteroidetes bacterium HGW-Bacteroidetes-1]